MSAPPYMKLYVADYLADTTHLTRGEHGAYLLLLMAMWRAGGKLPADDGRLAKIAMCSAKEWSAMRSTILGLFVRRGSILTHKRVAREIAKYETVSERRKQAGKAGGTKTASKNKDKSAAFAEANDQQLPTKPEPEPEVRKKDADASSVASAAPKPTAQVLDLGLDPPGGRGPPMERDQEFNRLWELAPPQMRKRAKSRAKVWPEWLKAKRHDLPARILTGFARYKALDADLPRTGGPGLHIWLKDRTWEQWTSEAMPDPAASWTEAQWAVAIRIWRETGEWAAELGDTPDRPNCRAPPHLRPLPIAATA